MVRSAVVELHRQLNHRGEVSTPFPLTADMVRGDYLLSPYYGDGTEAMLISYFDTHHHLMVMYRSRPAETVRVIALPGMRGGEWKGQLPSELFGGWPFAVQDETRHRCWDAYSQLDEATRRSAAALPAFMTLLHLPLGEYQPLLEILLQQLTAALAGAPMSWVEAWD